MENKTALTQLIDILKNKEELSVLHKEAYKSISYEARKLLPIEKQQIIDTANHFGGKMSYVDAPSPAELYYSQTFKTKEQCPTNEKPS